MSIHPTDQPASSNEKMDLKQMEAMEYGLVVDPNTSGEPEVANVDDPWAIVELVDDSKPWSEMETIEKVKKVCINILKFIGVVSCLYLFICSLDILSSSFRLISGKSTSSIFQNSEVANNPVVGLMAGILITVLLQSSSTSTSIVVSMVSADILTVKQAIPIIMGANIGTSVTNTIVSFTQIANQNEFRRAFAGATVHDMFNWLTVFVLFPVEVITGAIWKKGFLEWLTWQMVKDVGTETSGGTEVKILQVITEPFTKLIIQLDTKVINGWTVEDPIYENYTSIIKDCFDNSTGIPADVSTCKPPYIFENTNLPDWAVGLILFLSSLVVMCSCLVILVKILNSIMKGYMANVIKKLINADIPYVPWITGYIAIFVGAGMTFVVQSSSVFTSTLTPLVGVGIISIQRVYPLFLGSNIGTTTTALLSALTATGERLIFTLQISLCHMFFNIIGILLFYPIPWFRFPIGMAKFLGNETAKYRWFAVLYLVGMFFFLPTFVLGLSFGGVVVVLAVLIPIIVLFIIIGIIKTFQKRCPAKLPPVMRNWKWLPEPLRSLAPYDRVFAGCACCNKCRPDDPKNKSNDEIVMVESSSSSGLDNSAYVPDNNEKSDR